MHFQWIFFLLVCVARVFPKVFFGIFNFSIVRSAPLFSAAILLFSHVRQIYFRRRFFSCSLLDCVWFSSGAKMCAECTLSFSTQSRDKRTSERSERSKNGLRWAMDQMRVVEHWITLYKRTPNPNSSGLLWEKLCRMWLIKSQCGMDESSLGAFDDGNQIRTAPNSTTKCIDVLHQMLT